MADFGYDVADYCDVDPLFGTLEDFDRLLATCHGHGIKVIIDWVERHSNWDESVLIVTADHGHYLVVDHPEALAPPKP